MRYHYPSKEETGRGEQVQLHGDWTVGSITFTPPQGLAEFNMGQHEKVAHMQPKKNNTRCLARHKVSTQFSFVAYTYTAHSIL